jgi:hypothetical protein
VDLVGRGIVAVRVGPRFYTLLRFVRDKLVHNGMVPSISIAERAIRQRHRPRLRPSEDTTICLN